MFAPQPPSSRSTVRIRARAAGFSLVKTLVVLAVCAILAAVAAPSWRSTSHSQRLRAITGAFVAHVQLARSEAIKRNSRVALCKSLTGTSCVSGGSWEAGWIVFHDANNNARADAGETLIGTGQPPAQGYRVMGNGMVSAYLSYNGTGMSRSTSGAFQAGTFTVCREGPGASEGREIVISAVGRPKVRKVVVTQCG
jgi:type IV fimbrial biogenesis protein FimT